MPSMDYCKFENTAIDLAACLESLDDCEQQTDREAVHALRVIVLARQIVARHGDVTAAELTAAPTITTQPLPDSITRKCEYCLRPATLQARPARGESVLICDAPACLEAFRDEA